MGILSVELYRVRARNCNSERVIFFQSIILQRAQVVNNSAQIRKRVFFLLDFLNRGAFDNIVKDTYNYAMGYLGKVFGSQNEEKRHRTFSNLVLKVKFRESVRFVCDREKGVFLQLD